MQNNDTWTLGGHTFTSRFILGSGKYNLNLIRAAVEDAGAEIITLALRRVNTRKEENILDYIPEGVTLLPNTSGARNAEEAVRLARLAVKWAAVILLKSKSCMIPNTFCRIIMKRLRLQRFLQRKDLSLCLICIRI